MRKAKKISLPLFRRPVIMAGIAVVLLLLLFVILELTNTIDVFHSKLPAPTSTANSQTKGEPAQQPSPSPSQSPSPEPQPGDNKSSSGGTDNPSQTLLEPTGIFVSNHLPGQNGAPMTIQSNCTTTPGATCQINFIKDGVTKSLPSQTTDRGGSTYWQAWEPRDIGLTAGSWRVQAAATLNGQSKTAYDGQNLEVSP